MSTTEKFLDYYDIFELERSMTEKELKKELGKKLCNVRMYQNSTNPNELETLKELQETTLKLQKAIAVLGKPDSRKKYDMMLDEAQKAGKVDKSTSEETRDILKRAREFLKKGKFKLAIENAREAIDNHINTEEPYQIIAESYFKMGDYDEAIINVEKSSAMFSKSVSLAWMNIRYLTMIENFDAAQAKLNTAMKNFAGSALIAAEQIYLYGYAERDDLVRQTIEEYLKRNPNDMEYRRYAANNLKAISELCYVYAVPDDNEFYYVNDNEYSYAYSPDNERSVKRILIEETAFNRCLNFSNMANEIYQDENIISMVDYIKQFGEMVFDDERKGIIRFYRWSGIALVAIGLYLLINKSVNVVVILILIGIGILCQGAVALLTKISYCPKWMKCRDDVRHYKENDDGFIYNLLSIPFGIVEETFDMFH